jgi:O-antigen biosynthesis protein WbqP
LKRFFNAFFALIIITALMPLFILIYILIKTTSKGNVIFTQRRIGINKKEFDMYKFRTMYSSTPSNMPTHLLEDAHKHITPIGRFLRKTSLDELPQLFNILKGDMNFVGPRPALYNQYDLIELRDKYGISSIKPGITGWAQVNGRDQLDITTKIEYDRCYYEKKSLRMDIKIIFLTIYCVFRGKGVVEGRQSSENAVSS